MEAIDKTYTDLTNAVKERKEMASYLGKQAAYEAMMCSMQTAAVNSCIVDFGTRHQLLSIKCITDVQRADMRDLLENLKESLTLLPQAVVAPGEVPIIQDRMGLQTEMVKYDCAKALAELCQVFSKAKIDHDIDLTMPPSSDILTHIGETPEDDAEVGAGGTNSRAGEGCLEVVGTEGENKGEVESAESI